MELEVRSAELRVAGTDEQPVLTGYAAVFNERSKPLPFIERIRPGAFKRSLEGGDILALVDHDRGRVIGRQSNGTLTLKEDEHGLLVEIKPNMETSFGRDIVASVKRRDIASMSFGFHCRKDEWLPNPEGTGQLRDVIEADLKEVSVVSLPAYTGTNIQKRSQEDKNMTINEREARQKLVGLKEKLDGLQDEKRIVELTREIRSLEKRIEAGEFAKEEPAKGTPVLENVHAVSEETRAFNAYLRGQQYDTRALMSSVAASGGVMAPEGFLAELIKELTQQSVMRKLARVIGPIDNRSVKIPRNLTGVDAAWTDEAQAIVPSDPTFDQMELVPYKLAALTTVSNELLADSGINVESFLAQLFGERFAAVEDEAFFIGDGQGKPTGILTYAAIDRLFTGAVGLISSDDLIDLYDALPAPYRANAVWVMNPAVMNQLRKLMDGNGQYLMVNGFSQGAPTNILGRPVVLSDNMPLPGVGNDVIIFADFSRAYYICDRKGLDIQRSVDRYFEQDLTAFRAIKRTDGQLALANAARILVMQ